MHRYYFEFSLGQNRLADREGEEFASRVDALKYGRLLAGEMAKRNLAEMRDACVVVLDDRGAELGRIFLLDAVEVGPVRAGGRRILH